MELITLEVDANVAGYIASIAEAKKEASGLEQTHITAVANMNAASATAANSISGMRTRVEELNKSLQGLDVGSQAFRDTRQEAEKLELQIRKATGVIDEFGNRIRNAGSGKQTFTELGHAVEGLSGPLLIMNGLMDDGEKKSKKAQIAEQALLIVMGLRGTMMGIVAAKEIVANSLTSLRISLIARQTQVEKASAIASQLAAGATEAEAAAAGEAAAAQVTLNSAVLANPYVLAAAAVIALTAAIVIYANQTSKAEDKTALLNKQIKEVNESAKDELSKADALYAQLGNVNIPIDERNKILKDIQDSYGTLTEYANADLVTQNAITEATKQTNDEILKGIIMQKRSADIAEIEQNRLDDLERARQNKARFLTTNSLADYNTAMAQMNKKYDDQIKAIIDNSNEIESMAGITGDTKSKPGKDSQKEINNIIAFVQKSNESKRKQEITEAEKTYNNVTVPEFERNKAELEKEGITLTSLQEAQRNKIAQINKKWDLEDAKLAKEARKKKEEIAAKEQEFLANLDKAKQHASEDRALNFEDIFKGREESIATDKTNAEIAANEEYKASLKTTDDQIALKKKITQINADELQKQLSLYKISLNLLKQNDQISTDDREKIEKELTKKILDARLKLSKEQDDGTEGFKYKNLGQVGPEGRSKGEEDRDAKADALHKAELEATKELADATLNIVKESVDAQFAYKEHLANLAYDNNVARLEKQKQAGILSETQYNQQKLLLDQKKKADDLKIKQDQAKSDKELALFQIAINTAAAIVKDTALFGGVLSVPAIIKDIATGASQAAVVEARQLPRFAKGKRYVEGPGTSTSDSIFAMLSRGERVVTADMNRKHGPLLDDIHYDRVPFGYRDIMHQYAMMENISRQSQVRDRPISKEQLTEALKIAVTTDNSKELNMLDRGLLNSGRMVQSLKNIEKASKNNKRAD